MLLALLLANGASGRAAELRNLSGKHLELVTDLPASPEVDRLPALFDAAVADWCRRFDVDPADVQDWRAVACLMQDRQRFQAAGLLPADLPGFAHGLAAANELWLDDQPTDYYRRHLLLHEGVHAWMVNLRGGCGPPWYREGLAEWLGTHRVLGPSADSTRVEMGVFPDRPDDFPHWGRIRLIRDELAAGKNKTLDQALALTNEDFIAGDQAYAWAWALATFLQQHPMSRELFSQLPAHVSGGEFDIEIRKALADIWPQLSADWATFIASLDYGYDIPRAATRWAKHVAPCRRATRVEVETHLGWQSTGLELEAGQTYEITATGRYVVRRAPAEMRAAEFAPWPCEAGGVTIEYWQGRPLGQLLGAVQADPPSAESAVGLLEPFPIGLNTRITPEQSGVLFLRINESAGQLADNQGQLQVTITPVSGDPQSVIQ
jgi:hypothetical protein